MVEILRLNDPVLISYIMSVFEDEAIQAVVLDEHTSILEGSIGAVQRRIMVLEKDKIRAEAIVEDLVPGELKGDG
ncbi:DUF2007 domain-containing protein [Sneathiella aquimaris]|uniref:putative signal transducing protein n=2 Tax=Sneathiella aquimaris TaxID=2599305 RepID=UPI00146AD9EA|nr:DUF2007 domain-containing protein [Sneathiella aquimaris]